MYFNYSGFVFQCILSMIVLYLDQLVLKGNFLNFNQKWGITKRKIALTMTSYNYLKVIELKNRTDFEGKQSN